MNFICQHCKTKYQIADEKVAGRSVRMKCRKCGEMIVLGKAATTKPEATPLPQSSATAPAVPAARPAPSAPKPPVPQARAGAPPSGWREPGGVGVPKPAAPSPVKPPAAPAARPAASPPRAPAAARPAPVKPPLPARKPLQPSRPAAARAPAPKPEASSHEPPWTKSAAPPAPAAAPAEPPPVQPSAGLALYDADDENAPTVIASSSALAGAFTEAVRAPEAAATRPIASDEWYVGIHGSAVGPIRLMELRAKATAGAVTEESLVWQDGFEQWQPLKRFPELLAIVEEGRASLTPLAASIVAPLASPPAPPPPPTPIAGVMNDPFAVGSTPVDRGEAFDAAVMTPRRGGGFAPWIAVVVALLFGLTVGFVLFSREPAQPVVQYVEVPAKSPAGEAPPAPPGADTAAAPEPEASAGAPAATAPAARSGGSGTMAAKTQEADKPTSGALAGLKGLSAVSGEGPATGPTRQSSGSGAGGQLESDQVQRTVSRYSASVRRSCWQPALDTRAADAPTSARVSVAITVGPSGSVQNVTTSGDPKGYRGLAGCISGRVRGWQFPASSGTTTVNVPFVFAAQ
jgi:predicted Zn finger-like uncharacterized protein